MIAIIATAIACFIVGGILSYSVFSLSIFCSFSLFTAQTGSFNSILNNFCPLLICHFPSLLINTSMFAYRTNGLIL